jgi:hypothetical protein
MGDQILTINTKIVMAEMKPIIALALGKSILGKLGLLKRTRHTT